MMIDDPRKGLLEQPHARQGGTPAPPQDAETPVSPEVNVNDAQAQAPQPGEDDKS